MRQLLVVGIVLFLSGLGRLSSADPSDGRVARQLAEIKKKFEVEEKELKTKLVATDDASEKKQIAFSIKELSALAASDAVDLAVANPKQEAGLEAAVFAIKLLGEFKLTGRDWDKAVAVVLDNHLDNPKIEGTLAQMSQAGPTGKQFLNTVAEKTTNKEIKALAFYHVALALGAEASDHDAEGYNVSADKLRGLAVETMDKAVKLAPDAKVGGKPLAEVAKIELVSLKIGIGNALPDVEGIDLDGKKVKLSSFLGKVVLLDFWATWCGPCVKMLPHERELYERLSKKGFVLLSVNVDEEKSTLTEFMTTEKMPWSHWWDGQSGPIAKLFRVRAYPTLYLIDAKGILRKKWVGSPGDDVLDKAIEELIAQSPDGKR